MITIESLRERPLSFSSIKEFAKSPMHYIDYINRPKTPPTDAMKLGSLVHCLMLRPELFNDQFAISPDINKRTNAGKEEWAEFCRLNEGKDVIENSDYEHARKLVDTAMTNDHIYNAVKSCHDFEKEWSMEIDDLPYRGFYDGISTDYILEVKTINDGNPKNVMSDFYKRKYHMQASLYSMSQFGLPVMYIIIETSQPYLSYVAMADDNYIEQGAKEIGRLNESFKECMEGNKFNTGYEFHISGNMKISLPWSVEK
jgi:hypothetical protein